MKICPSYIWMSQIMKELAGGQDAKQPEGLLEGEDYEPGKEGLIKNSTSYSKDRDAVIDNARIEELWNQKWFLDAMKELGDQEWERCEFEAKEGFKESVPYGDRGHESDAGSEADKNAHNSYATEATTIGPAL